MSLPTPDQHINLTRMIPLLSEMILYCRQQVLDSDIDGCISYDGHQDVIIYHLKISDMDRAMFEWLRGTEEMWILERANTVIADN